MTDNTPNPNPTAPPAPPEPVDWRDSRRQRREERREARGRMGGNWIGGVILIALGVIFLLQNYGALQLRNWWALFILIPAVGSFGAAWRAFQGAGGRITGAAIGSVIGGLVLTAVSAAFLFELNLNLLGPVLLVVAGVGMLIGTLLGGR